MGSLNAPPAKRQDRPCDACRKRKSRCVQETDSPVCVLCKFHGQACTFLQSPVSRKRTLSVSAGENGPPAKRAPQTPPTRVIRTTCGTGVEEYDELQGPSLLKKTLGLQNTHHSQYVGPTGGIEAALVGSLPEETKFKLACASGPQTTTTLRRVHDGDAFLLLPDAGTPNYADELRQLDAIEETVRPFGRRLVSLYFRIVFPSFPVLHKEVFLEKYARSYREFSPPCLAAVYLLALQYWAYDDQLSGRHAGRSSPLDDGQLGANDDDDDDDNNNNNNNNNSSSSSSSNDTEDGGSIGKNGCQSSAPRPRQKPDESKLEELARKAFQDTLHRPKLSTVQAGLLLLQYTTDTGRGNSAELTSQLISLGFGLGLHLDASDWSIPAWEKGLRKRMAWALYMQDKWTSLGTGRPSLIHAADWAVQRVTDADFPENAAHEDDQEGSSEVEQGKALFCCMISLTQILAELLDQLFTTRARSEIAAAAAATSASDQQRLALVLARAKPVQLRLREWFSSLPAHLSTMQVTHVMKLSSVGYLRLAYVAVEITLHRRILLALSPSTDPRLTRICRSVARERFLFAVDFVQSLRPQHLSSFWYFASAQNLALIGLFGTLLQWTAGATDDADAAADDDDADDDDDNDEASAVSEDLLDEQALYREKLREYRWMLKMHSENGARFMKPAIALLDANLQLFEAAQASCGRQASGQGN